MRLLTRSDFDGICCAVLLKELGLMDEMVYAHPKDLQDGKIPVTKDDILANVPYVPGCGLWFDHHSSERERVSLQGQYEGRSTNAPSAARVVYDYYGPEKLARFSEMLRYVDKVDSAQLTEDEILNPAGWILLGFICDPRTGLGYHKNYRISNLAFMNDLVEHMRTKSIDEILALPDTRERIALYRENDQKGRAFLKERSRADGPVVVTDARGAAEIPPSNRFLIYSLFPETNISIRLIDGRGKEFVAISVGYSILNRSATVDVGSLMLRYGGGGHKAVGTCQVPYDQADKVLNELMAACKG
ncbi:exopolyphosphatase [Geobacter sp. AOG1]|uniref:exopolyphosphatase n=1 Tax=Geobacter sp. AOG1 TaxID=1566346 RepID=UPI001CC3A70A|nr:exopolyphosphatase [Geobacter sp. AOG1]GFE56966.1 exopolyphosphatase [Geobacter sp. AOG1]